MELLIPADPKKIFEGSKTVRGDDVGFSAVHSHCVMAYPTFSIEKSVGVFLQTGDVNRHDINVFAHSLSYNFTHLIFPLELVSNWIAILTASLIVAPAIKAARAAVPPVPTVTYSS